LILKKDKLVNFGQFYQPVRFTNEFRAYLHSKYSNADNQNFVSELSVKRRLFVAKLDGL